MTVHATRNQSRRTRFEWFVSLPVLALLASVLLISMGELLHSQMLHIGETMFGDRIRQVQYFALRADPPPLRCNPYIDVETEVLALTLRQAQGHDAMDELLGSDSTPMVQLQAQWRRSVSAAKAQCIEQLRGRNEILARLTPEVRLYRSVEMGFFELFKFGTEARPLILLMLIGLAMIGATVSHEHMALTPPRHARDFRLQSVVMWLACSFVLWSALRYQQLSLSNGMPVERASLHVAWIGLLCTMWLVSAWRCVWPGRRASRAPQGSWVQAIKTAPLAGVMAVVAGLYFELQGHPAGLAIHLHSLMEVPSLTLHLALFIWCGTLFKQSRMVDLFMNLLRPWRLSPEVLAFLILLVSAVPTAYTGGSGVFVMAAGAIIYHEIRDAGGSDRYALAVAATSGSLGMVLRPSLLVLAVVAMNRNVTSQELFHWGVWVFMLSATLFLLISLIARPARVRPALGWRDRAVSALPEMLTHVPPLLPHLVGTMAVIGLFSEVLGTQLNDNSAPLMMPVILLVVLLFDKLMLAQGIGPQASRLAQALRRERSFEGSVRAATTEAVGHLGGYVFLIVMSQAMGGVIERSGLIHLAPEHFASTFSAMAFMVVALVVLGMFMEPLGAIFLVSGSLAPLAVANGISPLHFWVMVLVAFELGYVMPPIALNQMLARRVLGPVPLAASDSQAEQLSFYRRHERWILPCGVLTLALLLVAFLPLMWSPSAPHGAWVVQLLGSGAR